MTKTETNARPSFGEAFKVWLKIGCINFGGPAGQIALMHRTVVDDKKWVEDARFLHALNFCMLLPGPEAQKLATYLGWLLHGVRGGLAAGILFVDPTEVVNVARESGGVPFDIKDVELSHEGERCSFDTMLKLFGLEGEPSLAQLALIVRGADTARPDFAPEAAGLHAISLGLSHLTGDDDHGLLERGFMVYDALFAWLRFAAEERHNWPARA